MCIIHLGYIVLHLPASAFNINFTLLGFAFITVNFF